MLVVSPGRLSPELVLAIQRFRGDIYLADGALPALEDGLHIEEADLTSYHLVEFREGGIAGCLRYAQVGPQKARIGGWAVAPRFRHTRVGVKLALSTLRLAEQLGDTWGTAHATVRHGSADILQRIGGVERFRYWDRAYGCEMVSLEFHLDSLREINRERRAA